MKILVVQLARLGDIYQTWPTLRALRRRYPRAQIDLLVRSKFRGATRGLSEVDHVLHMNSTQILEPIINNSDINLAVDKLNQWVKELTQLEYDQVINLSFSPLSSYLCRAISGPDTQMRGYLRYSDGHLAIADSTSAYFYAQVGPGKFNRIHLVDLFAGVAGVELCDSDWSPPKEFVDAQFATQTLKKFDLLTNQYVVMHVGASQPSKAYGGFKWKQVLSGLRKQSLITVVLVGTSGEKPIAQQILQDSSITRVIDLTGKTCIEELFPLVANSCLAVGVDSVVMHIASLVQRPCLNLSFSSVNFWETGPLAFGSRIIYADFPELLASDRVADEILFYINESLSPYSIIKCRAPSPTRYEVSGYKFSGFEWQLIEALYFGKPFPLLDDFTVYQGLVRLNQVVQLAIEQIPNVLVPDQRKFATEVLEQLDVLLQSFEQMVPALRPLIGWFQAERVRIGPGSLQEIVVKTDRVFKTLASIIMNYVDDPLPPKKGDSHADSNVL